MSTIADSPFAPPDYAGDNTGIDTDMLLSGISSAQASTDAALAALANLQVSIAGVGGAAYTTVTAPDPTTAQLQFTSELGECVWNLPEPPEAFMGTFDLETYLPEPFDGNPPTLVIPAAPERAFGVAPDAPPIEFDFDDPTLTVNLPAVPDLLTLNVTSFDGMNIPTFDATSPQLDVVAPSVVQYEPGDLYASDLLADVQSRLIEVITVGGTGIKPEVEDAIWDRGREREARAKAAAIADLERMESMGLMMPSGVYMDARLKIEDEYQQTSVGLSREIMIKQAELELEAVNRGMEQAISLEGKLMDYRNAVEQRMFDSARYATEAGISIYNAKVQAFGALTDAYRTKSMVYEAQIRAEVSKVEAYKAEIDAERAKADVNSSLVQQYEAQIRGALANVDIYRAEVDAIRTKAEIEKTKVEIFGEQVRAYTAEINAYTADVEGYRARLQAEGTKQDAYKSQVDAYRAEVEANSVATTAQIEVYKAELSAKELEYQNYNAQLASIDAQIGACATIAQAEASIESSQLQAQTSYDTYLARLYEVKVSEARAAADVQIANSRVQADMAISQAELVAEAARTTAMINAQIVASLASTISVSTSYSASESQSSAFSRSNSFSENYNYNYSV